MKTFKKITKSYDCETDIKYFCDLCGNEIKRGHYSKDVSKAQYKEGYWFPSGGTVEIEEVYFCEQCGIKIKDIIKKAGVKFTKREIDY